jgi:hypothetical protein
MPAISPEAAVRVVMETFTDNEYNLRYCSQTSRDMIKEFFSLKRGLLS